MMSGMGSKEMGSNGIVWNGIEWNEISILLFGYFMIEWSKIYI